MQSNDGVTVMPRTARRRFRAQFKRDPVEQTLRRDVSPAAVALANGVSANPLSRWRRLHLQQTTAATFVPVEVVEAARSAHATPVRAPSGEIASRHGATCLTTRAHVDAAILRTITSQALARGGTASACPQEHRSGVSPAWLICVAASTA